MIQFYETYVGNEIVSPPVSQISWTNNIVIFSHKSSLEEKEFYIHLCIKNNYSKRELERQIANVRSSILITSKRFLSIEQKYRDKRSQVFAE